MSDISVFHPVLPSAPHRHVTWGSLSDSSAALALYQAAGMADAPVCAITATQRDADDLLATLEFFNGDNTLTILHFPDWETLPYDHFSPHQDIISERLATLQRLPQLKRGIVVVAIHTLMQRIAPPHYIDQYAFSLKTGEHINMDNFRQRLTRAGYRLVNQVMEHGEYAVRGSIIDLYPMGSKRPFRLDLFDDEIESIRYFDADTQRSIETVPQIQLLPARELPLDEAAITHFRQQWRHQFSGNTAHMLIYNQVSDGIAPHGIEYYLPLFFEETCSLLQYLPSTSYIARLPGCTEKADHYWQEISERYEQLCHDVQHPILSPQQVFWASNEIFAQCRQFSLIDIQTDAILSRSNASSYATQALSQISIEHQAEIPLQRLKAFLAQATQRVLFCAASPGRQSLLLERLKTIDLMPEPVDSWQKFLTQETPVNITHGPLPKGLSLTSPALTVIIEEQLLGEKVAPRRRKNTRNIDPNTIIRDLVELNIGSPVVHIDYGVGRYFGLQTLAVGPQVNEFLTLVYANDDKIYVPVTSLHLISRYTGGDADSAPLTKLGTQQWQKAKEKVAKKIHDVAAELLNIYAQRAAQKGEKYQHPRKAYQAFSSEFPFEETPDQQRAIEYVIADMTSDKPMDRLVCGDVGFGKTEVAMRAAFIAVQNNKQVAILVPTTLLAEQHFNNFSDRFAKHPFRIELLSRFRSVQQQQQTLVDLSNGKVDIVIGTHRLIQKDIQFKRLGLVILDEEHRFGVRQKEYLKKMRTQVDMLALTATPIPRTLNMAMAELRDISLIATPPARRLAVKTFWQQKNKSTLREAVLREILRGGQVFFLHNSVETIDREAQTIRELIPEAKVGIGHGQMRESELEQTMNNFYHQRFNVLVCTTIIETGIDIPSANTIIINRADRFGLAQLHQLRGRVGRSHHQAYAYLLTPDKKTLSKDAVKRLAAITAFEDLGAGFMLATHDLEIRGAGELLGEEQSGNMHAVGFNLYMELLDRAVQGLKQGETVDLLQADHSGPNIDLKIPAIIPEHYLGDIHLRLTLYKRIASANSQTALDELQAEIIDRFGPLPDEVKSLLRVTQFKLTAEQLGIQGITGNAKNIKIVFSPKMKVDPNRLIQLVQKHPEQYQFAGSETIRLNQTTKSAEERLNTVASFIQSLEKP